MYTIDRGYDPTDHIEDDCGEIDHDVGLCVDCSISVVEEREKEEGGGREGGRKERKKEGAKREGRGKDKRGRARKGKLRRPAIVTPPFFLNDYLGKMGKMVGLFNF